MLRIPLVSEANMTDERRRVYDAMMHGPSSNAPPVGKINLPFFLSLRSSKECL